MSLTDIGAEHVRSVLAEADQMGRLAFLEANGFGVASTYLLRVKHRFYDPKAVVGVAHGKATGQRWQAKDLDATEAIGRLRVLGFDVVPFNGLWWVNQGATYRQERKGGFVWAPKVNKSGFELGHHVAVNKLRRGQRIVHYSQGHLRAIGTVLGEPTTMPRPSDFGTEAWDDEGYGCRVQYLDIHPPIQKVEVPERSPSAGPFDVNGDVKQGYLFRVSDEGLFPLLSFLDERVPNLFDRSSLRDELEQTEDDVTALAPDPIHDLLMASKNVVLEGVPGTGKSYSVQVLAENWRRRTGRPLLSVEGRPYLSMVMHPSTSYEDFVEGIRPHTRVEPERAATAWFDRPVEGDQTFSVDDGFFLRACAHAVANPDSDVLVLLDELNRCNVPSVLGDLLLVLEASRRGRPPVDDGSAQAADWSVATPVRLPYSGRWFFVPDNLYVLATTNTTDRSVAPLDAAVRRRFAFLRIEPDFTGVRANAMHLPGAASATVLSSVDIVRRLNDEVLGPCIGPDAMLGPSYFYDLANSVDAGGNAQAAAARLWRFSVLPQLIDSLRSFGAEALLSPNLRGEWLSHHASEVDAQASVATALEAFDQHLATLGMQVLVEGTGLARGVRIIDAIGSAASAAQSASAATRGPVADVSFDDARAELGGHDSDLAKGEDATTGQSTRPDA